MATGQIGGSGYIPKSTKPPDFPGSQEQWDRYVELRNMQRNFGYTGYGSKMGTTSARRDALKSEWGVDPDIMRISNEMLYGMGVGGEGGAAALRPVSRQWIDDNKMEAYGARRAMEDIASGKGQSIAGRAARVEADNTARQQMALGRSAPGGYNPMAMRTAQMNAAAAGQNIAGQRAVAEAKERLQARDMYNQLVERDRAAAFQDWAQQQARAEAERRNQLQYASLIAGHNPNVGDGSQFGNYLASGANAASATMSMFS
jgi:hypothetical protein